MKEALGVAIIGIQGYGRTYFETLKAMENVRVLALCDINQDAAREAAAEHGVPSVYADYRGLLARIDLDAVFIATPHHLHYPITMDFLRAGKHVFCEKPLAISAEHAWEMARTSREQGVVLTCHYNRRQTAPVKMLRDIIQKCMLGEVYALNARWMARWTGFMFQSSTSWRVSKEKAGGGILIGRGSHMLDAALYILGHPKIRAVNAVTTSRLTGFAVDDYALVTLRLENGGLIHVECSYENNIPNYQEKIEYEVFGTKAGAYCGVVDGRETIQVGACAYPQNQWIDLTDQVTPSSYAEAEPKTIVGDFIDAIREQRDPIVTAEQSAYLTQLLETAYQSSEAGREIALQG
jgi:predicted dehydrogenase